MIFQKGKIADRYKAPIQTALKPQADDTYHRAPLTYVAHKLHHYQLILGEVYGMFDMELSCLKVSYV